MAGEEVAESPSDEDLAGALAQVEHLQKAVTSGRRIGMAMGILMERHGLSEEEAFDRLRTVSQHRNEKLRDVAERLLRTGELNA